MPATSTVPTTPRVSFAAFEKSVFCSDSPGLRRQRAGDFCTHIEARRVVLLNHEFRAGWKPQRRSFRQSRQFINAGQANICTDRMRPSAARPGPVPHEISASS